MNKIFLWLDRTIRFCLYGLVIAFPLGNAPVEIFGNLAAGLYLLKWLLLLSCSAWSDRSFKEAGTVGGEKYVLTAVFAYAVWNMVSAIGSVDDALSWRAIYGKLLEGVLVFFAARAHIYKKQHVRILINCALAAAGLAALNGLWQWFFEKDLIRQSSVFLGPTVEKRMSSSFRHPNGFGSYLIFWIPLTVAWSFMFKYVRSDQTAHPQRPVIGWQRMIQPGSSKMYLLMLMVVLVVCLGLTFSRGAWLGLFAGMIFLLLHHKRFFLPLLIGGAVILMIFAPMMSSSRSMDFIQKATIASSNDLPGRMIEIFQKSSSGRWTFWQDAWQAASLRPVTGWGLNTYTQVINTLPGTREGYYAHNCYLQMTVEIGFVGLVLFLSIAGLFYAHIRAELSRMPKGYLRVICLGAASGLLAFLVHAFFDTNFYSVQLALLPWLGMGLCLSVVRISRAEPASHIDKP
ncbi:MAG: O-antigen ligase family protein [Candidatus Omnitrophota bacterium]